MIEWKNCAISEGDRDGHLVYVRPVCVVFLVSGAGKVCGLYAIFEGSQSWGGCWVKLFG